MSAIHVVTRPEPQASATPEVYREWYAEEMALRKRTQGELEVLAARFKTAVQDHALDIAEFQEDHRKHVARLETRLHNTRTWVVIGWALAAFLLALIISGRTL